MGGTPPKPRVPPPQPVPIPDKEGLTADFAEIQRRRQSSSRKTVLAGNLEPTSKGLKTMLG